MSKSGHIGFTDEDHEILHLITELVKKILDGQLVVLKTEKAVCRVCGYKFKSLISESEA